MKEISATHLSTLVAWVLLVSLFVSCVVVWGVVLAQEPEGNLTVAFLDVGQGDAIYIETPSGNQVLIDGGKSSVVFRALGEVMPFYDRSIDVVLATHPDSDHIGGLPELFSRFNVSMFIEAGVRDEGAENKALHAAVVDEGLTVLEANSAMSVILDTDVVLTFLFPDRDVDSLETNTASIVTKLTYNDTSFILTGDSPAGIETYLATVYGDALKSDVLKLGHHGSKTSTTDIFLGYVAPEYGVISVGCDNSYGHPHKEVLDRLATFDITTLNTCTDGTVIFKSDGTTVTKVNS